MTISVGGEGRSCPDWGESKACHQDNPLRVIPNHPNSEIVKFELRYTVKLHLGNVFDARAANVRGDIADHLELCLLVLIVRP